MSESSSRLGYRTRPVEDRAERMVQEEAVLLEARKLMAIPRLRVSEIKRLIRSRFEGLLPGVLNRVIGSLVAAERGKGSKKADAGGGEGHRRSGVPSKGATVRGKTKSGSRGFGDEDRGIRVFPDATTKIARSEWRKRVRGQMCVQCTWCGYWIHERRMPEHKSECRWMAIGRQNPDQFRPDWTGGLPVRKRDEIPFPLQARPPR